MPLTTEDVASIQEMINTGLMPAVEKMVEEKVAGLASVVQGILNQSQPETPEGATVNPILGILASLAPVLLQVLPMLKGQQQSDPMAQFNSMAAMMRTASDVMLRPVIDIWRDGMSFGVNAVSVAQRATGQVDAGAFDRLIKTQETPQVTPVNGQMSQGGFDYEAHASRLADQIR